MSSLTHFTDQAMLLPLARGIARVPGLSRRARGAVRLIAVAGRLATITLLKTLFGARGAARRGGGGASTMNFGHSE